MKITVNKITRTPHPSKQKIIRLARGVLRGLGRRNFTLEIDLVDNRTIRQLNRRFRKIDRATDVLAFDLKEMGEVVVSVDMARQRTREGTSSSFTEELNRYIIHGILHLTGWDDKTPPRRRRMLKKEEELVKKWLRK